MVISQKRTSGPEYIPVDTRSFVLALPATVWNNSVARYWVSGKRIQYWCWRRETIRGSPC
jgi:hypothetical protein